MKTLNTSGHEAINVNRRKLLIGAAAASAVSFAPAALSSTLTAGATPELTGKLICNISNPMKTLVLSNNTDKTIHLDQVSQGAFMFDGTIVDCNAACLGTPITIPPKQDIQIQFEKRQQFSLTTKIRDHKRIQSKVIRLSDGTRIIPFSATVSGNIATVA